MQTRYRHGLTSILGAIAGGIAGYFVFLWLARTYGALGFAIPGVGVAIGTGFFRCPSKLLAGLIGLGALFAGLYSSWILLRARGSFGSFLRNVLDLPSYQLILIFLGAVIAFWIAVRRTPKPLD